MQPFFFFYQQKQKENFNKRVTELLAIYTDVELLYSIMHKETHPEIAARLDIFIRKQLKVSISAFRSKIYINYIKF